nr:MAG TPA: hypothetical protein [Caudoviricetes sp.]
MKIFFFFIPVKFRGPKLLHLKFFFFSKRVDF